MSHGRAPSPLNQRARGSRLSTQLAGISHYLAVRSGRSVSVFSVVCPRSVSTQPPAAKVLASLLDRSSGGVDDQYVGLGPAGDFGWD